MNPIKRNGIFLQNSKDIKAVYTNIATFGTLEGANKYDVIIANEPAERRREAGEAAAL